MNRYRVKMQRTVVHSYTVEVETENMEAAKQMAADRIEATAVPVLHEDRSTSQGFFVVSVKELEQ
jgi:hypothetical protein